MSSGATVPTPAPSDLPTYTIKIGGAKIAPVHKVVSVVVTKGANRISSAKITVLDGDAAAGDFAASSSEDFVPGRPIEIFAGYHAKEEAVFSGLIVKQSIRAGAERSGRLTVDCRHCAVKMTATPRSAVYADSTDSEVFEELLRRYVFDTALIGSTAARHAALVQYRATDWDFLVTRAEANGMLVFTNLDKIAVCKPVFSDEPVLTLAYGSTIVDLDAELDARIQIAGAVVRAWDASSQRVVESEGPEPAAPKQGNLDAADLAKAVGGEAAAIEHCGDVPEHELRSLAEARLMKARVGKVRGRVRFTGYGGVNPGNMIRLEGLGARMSGPAYVTGVRHELGGGTWLTDVEFGLSQEWFGQRVNTGNGDACLFVPPVTGLQVGVVDKLEGDPAGEDRVQVRLALVSGSAGVWARVAAVDAGNERGAFFRPEIGDEVVLGFLNDDPRHPVVLGMLNSSAKPAPIKASDDNDEKGFVTRGKIRLIFNDKNGSVEIATPKGKVVKASDADDSVSMQDEHGNRIAMSADGITIESPGAVKVSGLKGAEISSPAATKVAGMPVQIN